MIKFSNSKWSKEWEIQVWKIHGSKQKFPSQFFMISFRFRWRKEILRIKISMVAIHFDPLDGKKNLFSEMIEVD